MKRKFLSILLTLAMALTLLPTAAMADETPSEGGGSAPVEAPVETKVAQIGDNSMRRWLRLLTRFRRTRLKLRLFC